MIPAFDVVLLLQIGKVLLAFLPLMLIPVLIFLERKGASLIQDRLGPNRAAIPLFGGLRMFGFIHNLSDGIKLFTKESFIPALAHKGWYLVAPAIPIAIALLTPSVLPWFAPMLVEGSNGAVWVTGQIMDADAGVLVLFALSGLSVYGVVLGSWASNSKYSLLGGMRASAMMISYEVSMGLSAAGLFLLVGSFGLTQIVEWQASHVWGIVAQPVGFVLFLVALFAETGRAPFDVAEGDSEIVAGYFTEYSAIRFGLYYMGEYAHIAIASALVSTLFLGGYDLPFVHTEDIRAHLGWVVGWLLAIFGLGLVVLVLSLRRFAAVYATNRASDKTQRASEWAFISKVFGSLAALLLIGAVAAAVLICPQPISQSVQGTLWPLWVNLLTAAVQVGVVIAKTLAFCWVFIWVRWTLPRFRYDQIMSLGWKVLLNVALVNLLVTAVVAKLLKGG